MQNSSHGLCSISCTELDHTCFIRTEGHDDILFFLHQKRFCCEISMCVRPIYVKDNITQQICRYTNPCTWWTLMERLGRHSPENIKVFLNKTEKTVNFLLENLWILGPSLGILEKFQCSSALPNIKYNCAILFLCQMYWSLVYASKNSFS